MNITKRFKENIKQIILDNSISDRQEGYEYLKQFLGGEYLSLKEFSKICQEMDWRFQKK